jgi:ABC-2 type transport system ATP-binding protein
MITVSGLTKQYGKRVAVDDLSFDVAAGRVTGFVGPNGAGKSTTMRMMVGLTRPDRGEVRCSRVRYRDLKSPSRIVGSVLDARCMHPGRTARKHLLATAAVSGLPAARADEVLDEVGLETAADQRAGGFSLGMRQRLALAGALLGDPEVLLLDEPSNGLDPDGIRWLRTYLNDFAERGGTVFVSSHLIGELAMFADDLVVVGAGRLIAAEPVEAITARNAVTVVVETPQPSELVALLSFHGLTAEASGHHLLVPGTTTAAVSQIAFDGGIRLVELTETSASLEDSLLELTGASAEFASIHTNPTHEGSNR